MKKIAELLLLDFVKSIINYEHIHERFRTFLNFCGIHNKTSFQKQNFKKSELLFEKQFSSIDSLRIYLKILHVLRIGKTPLLPDINCESSTRIRNGVLVNFSDAKQIFFSILQEEGEQTD